MTENSSVTALMGNTIPNQKEPPDGGRDPNGLKLYRNETGMRRYVTTLFLRYISINLSVACRLKHLLCFMRYRPKRR